MNHLSYPRLLFSPCTLEVREEKGNLWVYDECRMRWVTLTPEEWVRQHVVHFLLHKRYYPRLLVHVEERVMVNDQPQRADIVVYGRDGLPFLLVECKAAHVSVDDNTLWQVATYNRVLRAPYVAVTNGMGIGVFQRTEDDSLQYCGEEIPNYPRRIED